MSQFYYRHGGSDEPSAKSALEAIDVRLSFNYLFPEMARDANHTLPQNSQTVANLKRLADLMAEVSDRESGESNIPAVYTYWGQFIDHDVTASDFSRIDADITADDLTPLAPDDIVRNVQNRRRPVLDLDSLYGDSPDEEAADFYAGQKFKLGTATSQGGTPNSELGIERDLPRPDAPANKVPRIGDTRNDENLIVAQFHTAFLKFHNAVVDWVATHEGKQGRDLYWRARQLVRFHYQWLVVNDFLKSICHPDVVDAALAKEPTDLVLKSTDFFMPLEYAGAVYRFGHSMVRGRYNYNQFFPNATFSLLFSFTGTGGFFGTATLPTNWIADWSRLASSNASTPENFARKIDTKLTIELADMGNEGDGLSGMAREIMRHLSQRNLLRGYLLSLPTGQAAASALGLTPMTSAEIQQGNSAEHNQHLADSGFLDATPLWYYTLKEAEVQEDGNALGAMGSTIVTETLISLLRRDVNSYLAKDWTPAQGVTFEDGSTITGIMDLFQFAGVALRD